MKNKYQVIAIMPLKATIEFKRLHDGKIFYIFFPAWREYSVGQIVELKKLKEETK
jgi:hypothetical protein